MSTTHVSADTFCEHWKPRSPRAGNLANVNRCVTREEALTRRFIQHNSPGYRNIIVLDLDRKTSGTGVFDAYCMVDSREIPPFNWVTESKSGGAHIAYVLADGVAWTERAREAPKRYFEDVRRALTAAAGADMHYINYMTYNPLHPAADTHWLRDAPWTLQDLHVALRPDGAPLLNADDHKAPSNRVDEYGESRHQTLYEELRRFAYTKWAEHYQDAEGKGKGRLTFYATVLAEGHRINDLMWPTNPLTQSAVESRARSVAGWTWSKFYSDSKGGRRTARVMRTQHVKTRAARIAELRELIAQGTEVTEQFIRDNYGVSRPTAISYMNQVGIGKAAKMAPLDVEVKRMLEAGETIAAVVRATGATRDQVRYSAKRQNIVPASTTRR